jgi:hypothetical protein
VDFPRRWPLETLKRKGPSPLRLSCAPTDWIISDQNIRIPRNRPAASAET